MKLFSKVPRCSKRLGETDSSLSKIEGSSVHGPNVVIAPRVSDISATSEHLVETAFEVVKLWRRAWQSSKVRVIRVANKWPIIALDG